MSKVKRQLPDKLKIHWLRVIIPMAVAVVLGIIIASVKYFGTERFITNAQGRIELNWDGASEGKAPNGEGYDLLKVDNDDIIARALTRLGLNVSVEEVKNNLVISGLYPDSIISNLTYTQDILHAGSAEEMKVTQFHPSSYSITLKDNFKSSMSRSTLASLLAEIMNGYREQFYSQYTLGYDTETIDGILDISKFDYNQILSVLTYRIELVSKNATAMAELNSSYRYNKQSFADMAVVAKQLLDTDLNRAVAECNVNGLSKDSNTMLQAYHYTIRDYQLRLKEAQANMDSVVAVIKIFERGQSAFVSTGTGAELVTGNSDRTYEELMGQQTKYAEQISEYTSKIAYYEELVVNVENSVKEAKYNEYCAALEVSIQELIKKTGELEQTMSSMVSDYNKTVIGDESVEISSVVVEHPKVISVGFIKALIKACGPFCMLVLIYALAMELLRQIKVDKYLTSEAEKCAE